MAEYGFTFMDHASIFTTKGAAQTQDTDSFEISQVLEDIGLTTAFESRCELAPVVVESAPVTNPIIPGINDPASLAMRVIEWLRAKLF